MTEDRKIMVQPEPPVAAAPASGLRGSVSEPSAPWRTIGRCKVADGVRVTLWLAWGASPLTIGMGDAFAVRDCWREGGRWVHMFRGKPAELASNYITHWRPSDAEPTAGPHGAYLDWWRP
jgi:hypothetical protein